MKRIMLLLAAALLALTGTAAAEAGTDGAFPPLNEAGFLDEGEFVFEDEEAGVWRYCSPELWVEITRREQEKPAQCWYEAEIRLAEGAPGFGMLPWNEKNRWKQLNYPYKIARKHQSVFAVNSDFAHLRLNKKQRAGILLRGGEIVYTHTNQPNRGFPNLDTLALFADGGMQVFTSNEHTAAEYAEMGAIDVLSFGPWLIRDGEINEKAIKKLGKERAQRTAVGLIGERHYAVIVTEGRKNDAKGTELMFVAEKMQAMGCTLAINLDGGQSSAMVFLGRQINVVLNAKGYRASARKTAEILAIGSSEACAAMDDPFR